MRSLKDEFELSDRARDHTASALLQGSLNMALSISEREEHVSGEEALDTESGELLQIPAIPIHARSGKVDEAEDAPVEEDIADEEIPSPFEFHEIADGIRTMSGDRNGLETQASGLDGLPISNGVIHRAVAVWKIRGIDPERLGQIQSHLLRRPLLQQRSAHLGEIDAASGEGAQLGGPAGMIEVIMRQKKCAHVTRIESLALDIADNLLA